MKFSTIMVVFALAFAFASAGCRYNKAGKGAGSGAGEGEGDLPRCNIRIAYGDGHLVADRDCGVAVGEGAAVLVKGIVPFEERERHKAFAGVREFDVDTV